MKADIYSRPSAVSLKVWLRETIIMFIHLLRAQQTELAIVKHANIKPLLQNLYVQNKIINLASLAQMMLNTSYAGPSY